MSTDHPPPKEDVVFVGGPAESGDGYQVIRRRDGAIEIGEVRAVQEGKPLAGELVRLKPRSESDRLFDVEVLVSREDLSQGRSREDPSQGRAAPRSGPAQVANDAYRANWETIFGARDPRRLAN